MFCMCDKTALESNFLMFYIVFQFVISCITQVQRDRMEHSAVDTFSKDFVSLAFLTKISIICFDKLRLWQETAAKPIAMHMQICLLNKK